MPKDLYAVLGLQRDASLDDIKKAYRRLSKELHPDKRKGDPSDPASVRAAKESEKTYKEVNEAYEVLSNPKKKQMYDQFGSVGGGPGESYGEFRGFDFSGDFGGLGDLFENFFGGAGGVGKTQTKGGDIEVVSEIPFSQVFSGVTKTFSLRRMVSCHSCRGSGVADGSKMTSCSACGGTGEISRTTKSFFGVIQQRALCDACRGSGHVPEKPCGKCGGDGRHNDKTDVQVEVPPGIQDGQTLRIRGEGEAGFPGGASGDLFVHIRVQSDPRFERDHNDVRSRIDIPLLDAILGGEVTAETVHGDVILNVPPGTQPGQTFRLKGKGLPVLGSSRYGDHFAEVDIEIPKKISRDERKLLEEWREIH